MSCRSRREGWWSSVSEPRRKGRRLPTYDYSQAGAYFVTVVVKERRRLFGENALRWQLASSPAP
jgi:hypothetical protein